MTESERKMMAALCAVLLFHDGDPWTEDKQARWKTLTGTDDATSRNLCETVRRVLPTLQYRSES